MFVRVKKNREYSYLQIVESRREGKSVKQRVLATLGQYDALAAAGKIEIGRLNFGLSMKRVPQR